ncbi:hypothetical protein LPJ66_002576 [Kickxella alabastrina]|uniref:Uncharacterized protein n=1 Tax=Kickxella alabastrina TaxID=61397 RepID=A0ACC1IQ59_9FUNG|nr:hypothetical protein LPJ66_002576 [Kickxella alabastrina]
MKLTLLAFVGLLASLASAHVSVISPCPRYSPVGENCPALPPGQSLDTGDSGINTPLYSATLGGTALPLCRHTTPFATPSATWTASKPVTIKFNPNAAIHSGGNCEFSISYDNGKTFAVIHQELRYCFLNSKPAGLTNTAQVLSYTFNLPANLPSSDKAVFAWTWINASGNREFYMNCADVAIKGGSSSSYTGKQMTIANYPGYPTIPEFNGDYDTGMEYYDNAKNITVSPSGGGGIPEDQNSNAESSVVVVSSSSETSSEAASEESTEDTNEPISTEITADSSTEATNELVSSDAEVTLPSEADGASSNSGPDTTLGPADDGSTPCTDGLLQCSGKGYRICVRGTWSSTYSCNGDTICYGTDGNIYCGWP